MLCFLSFLPSFGPAGLAAVASARVRAGAAHPSPSAPAADVLVSDALHLPYRSSSCDAVLCIAVLHHISTVARRVQLLRELARVLKPGGRGIVTVWATEQEDPAKTIKKWALIKEGTGAQAGDQQQQCEQEEEVAGRQEQQQQQQAQDSSAGVREGRELVAAAAGRGLVRDEGEPPVALGASEEGSKGWSADSSVPRREAGVTNGSSIGDADCGAAASLGPDYLVPWHVPFHRAGTLVKQVAQQEKQQQQSKGGLQEAAGAGTAGATTAAAGGAPRVDAAKGAVVYQRYYHLFEEGELQGLVAQVEGVGLVDAFYDRSNWCAVFGKDA